MQAGAGLLNVYISDQFQAVSWQIVRKLVASKSIIYNSWSTRHKFNNLQAGNESL
jgi:hypothetical protein